MNEPREILMTMKQSSLKRQEPYNYFLIFLNFLCPRYVCGIWFISFPVPVALNKVLCSCGFTGVSLVFF